MLILLSAISVSLRSVATSSLRLLARTFGAIAAAKLLGPGDQGAVAGYLIVLDRLRRGDQGRVQNLLVGNVAADFIGFLENTVDGRAIDCLGLDAMQFEDLFDALDVTRGLAKVFLEAGLQLRIGCLVDHLRKRLFDLLFGVIDVAQRVDEEVVQCL